MNTRAHARTLAHSRCAQPDARRHRVAAAVALFRAYFATTAPKEQRTGRFGLIGVITSASLFVGPSLGGEVARQYGRRTGCWLSTGLCLAGAFIAFLWRPDEGSVDKLQRQKSSSANLKGEELGAPPPRSARTSERVPRSV